MRCPVCHAADLSVFFETRQVPVLCNVLWPDQEQARQAPRGDIRLGFCAGCGMISNVDFDEQAIAYDPSYENSLHFSQRFQQYASKLARKLAARHDLAGKQVAEIGCGKGDFLRMLCKTGGCRGIGFDTSYEGPEQVEGDPVRFVRDFYSESYADLGADLVCCRHVLEHIPEPRGFLEGVRRAARGNPGAAVFFEVPHALYTLRDMGIWDIIYEHCSYYTAASLERLFLETGFGPRDTWTAYGDQFLCLDAALDPPASAPPAPSLDELSAWVDRFAGHQREKVDSWGDRLSRMFRAGQRVVIWGAGSKGVTFLNTVAGGEGVVAAIDINTRKQGRYVPGSGQPVVGPEALADQGADVVLVMNPLYVSEIRVQLLRLGLEPHILVV